jgi:hypothetical protein
MLPTETLYNEMPWNRLQEPLYATQLPQEYLLLLAALDTGWKITGPVHLCGLNHYTGDYIYLFNLDHEPLSQTVQLTVPVGPVVDNFLCEEGLVVLTNELTCSPHHQGLVC